MAYSIIDKPGRREREMLVELNGGSFWRRPSLLDMWEVIHHCSVPIPLVVYLIANFLGKSGLLQAYLDGSQAQESEMITDPEPQDIFWGSFKFLFLKS